MIYFDNNATTIMPDEVIRSMIEWTNMGNPSAGYASARKSRQMMSETRKYIAKLCKFNVCCEEERDTSDAPSLQKRQADPSLYKIIFVSCASEANATIITSTVDAYFEHKNIKPHIVISEVEHKSIINNVRSLEERGRIEATYIKPTISGHIMPQDVAIAIRPNTALVCIMHANNETGAINDIAEIGRIAHAKNVPFHTDTVQTFGKFPIDPIASNVDSFCVSFHKLLGPPGIGALIIKQRFLMGYELKPLIFGSQNEELRGGTENLPAIGASLKAMQITMTGRISKNNQHHAIKKYIMAELNKRIGTRDYVDYVKNPARNPLEIIFISGLSTMFYLPNTLLFSVIKYEGKPICNARLKKELENHGIIVSIGSACNTASPKASHVLYAMEADELIRKGTLRISIGDMNTLDDAKKFIASFIQVLKGEVSCS